MWTEEWRWLGVRAGASRDNARLCITIHPLIHEEQWTWKAIGIHVGRWRVREGARRQTKSEGYTGTDRD